MNRQTDDKSLLIFHFFNNLPYLPRVALAATLMVIGFLVQARLDSFWGGGLILLCASLLLTVKGYDSRVNFRSFDPSAAWEESSLDKLDEVITMHHRMKNWDRTVFDASNALGCLSLIVILIGLFLVLAGFIDDEDTGFTLLGDTLFLILPHWLTGMRRILKQPGLRTKAELVKRLLERIAAEDPDLVVNLQFCMHGTEHRIPKDIKFRLETATPREGSLGLYGQTVLNDVQGSSYPYFYMVLVAKPGCGLREVFERFQPPAGLVKEWEDKSGVEVLILRQHTTRTSGYHTIPATVDLILGQGIGLLRNFAGQTRQQG